MRTRARSIAKFNCSRMSKVTEPKAASSGHSAEWKSQTGQGNSQARFGMADAVVDIARREVEPLRRVSDLRWLAAHNKPWRERSLQNTANGSGSRFGGADLRRVSSRDRICLNLRHGEPVSQPKRPVLRIFWRRKTRHRVCWFWGHDSFSRFVGVRFLVILSGVGRRLGAAASARQ